MMRTLLFLNFIIWSLAMQSQIATIDGTAAGIGNIIDPNVTISNFSRGSGIMPVTNAATYNSKNFEIGSTARVADEYIEFSISSSTGYFLDISTLDIRYDRSSEGPSQVEIDAIIAGNSNLIFSDSNVDVDGENNLNIDISAFSGSVSITFRIYAYNALSSSGTFDIEPFSMSSDVALRINGSVPLPISLTSFSAEKMTQGAKLKWEVATQESNDFFGVEVSRDGNTFNEVARVNGDGTTREAKSYSYEYSLANRGTYYFRLRQVDFDGAHSYSPIVQVAFSDKGGITMYPVRGGILQAEFERGTTQVAVINMTGAVVAKGTPASNGSISIDVSSLAGGIYLLTDGVNTRRFVK